MIGVPAQPHFVGQTEIDGGASSSPGGTGRRALGRWCRRLVDNPERRRDERGQALVEFMLVVPLVLALTAGVFELGYYIHVRDVVDMAAAQAARTAATEGAITSDASQAATSVITGSGLSPKQAGYTMCVGTSCDSTAATGSPGTICAFQTPGAQLPPVSVTVSYDYHLLFPFLKSWLFLGIGRIAEGTFHEKVTLPAEVGWLPTNGPSLHSGQSVLCG